MSRKMKDTVAEVIILDDSSDDEAGGGVPRSVAPMLEENPQDPSPVPDFIIIDDDSDDDGVEGGEPQSFVSMMMEEDPQDPSPVPDTTVAPMETLDTTVAPMETLDTTVAPMETLDCRSFWKAGGNFATPMVVFPSAPGTLEHARVHPKFLHSNATSHKWSFGAIAELIDNSVDEIQNGATFVKIDLINLVKDNSPALVFQDDGGGMDPDRMRKCLSLGYSSKKPISTIGQYGNGFKTSTMRLGADAILFSRATRKGKITQSIGLLSYTFLTKTGQDDIITPIIDIDMSKEVPEPIIYGSASDWTDNLEIILKWSPFSTRNELLHQFEDMGPHGTKVVIYNLWLNDEGNYELIFDEDHEDIRLRDENVHDNGKPIPSKTLRLRSHISYRLRFSLRAYVSMLYLKKFQNFKIILRGVPVEQFNIADELGYPRTAVYTLHGPTMEKRVTVIKIGFVKEAPNLTLCGFNVYHKNRLIRPFWKVTPEHSSIGHGVVGVFEANLIEPAHDKQDFERSSLFQKLETKLKKIIADYWNKQCHFFGYYTPTTPVDLSKRKPILDQPQTSQGGPSGASSSRHVSVPPQPIETNNPLPLTFGQTSQGGSSGASSSRPVSVPPQPIETNNPLPLTFGQTSQGGTSGANSSRHVFVAPQTIGTNNPLALTFGQTSQGGSSGASSSGHVQLTPQPVVTTDTEDNHLIGKSADEIREENIQLFIECERYRMREEELEKMIKSMKEEVEEYRSKIAIIQQKIEQANV